MHDGEVGGAGEQGPQQGTAPPAAPAAELQRAKKDGSEPRTGMRGDGQLMANGLLQRAGAPPRCQHGPGQAVRVPRFDAEHRGRSRLRGVGPLLRRRANRVAQRSSRAQINHPQWTTARARARMLYFTLHVVSTSISICGATMPGCRCLCYSVGHGCSQRVGATCYSAFLHVTRLRIGAPETLVGPVPWTGPWYQQAGRWCNVVAVLVSYQASSFPSLPSPSILSLDVFVVVVVVVATSRIYATFSSPATSLQPPLACSKP